MVGAGEVGFFQHSLEIERHIGIARSQRHADARQPLPQPARIKLETPEGFRAMHAHRVVEARAPARDRLGHGERVFAIAQQVDLDQMRVRVANFGLLDVIPRSAAWDRDDVSINGRQFTNSTCSRYNSSCRCCRFAFGSVRIGTVATRAARRFSTSRD